MTTWVLIIWMGVYGNTVGSLNGFESERQCEHFLEELIVAAKEKGVEKMGGDCVVFYPLGTRTKVDD